jgi:hypothetical protein
VFTAFLLKGRAAKTPYRRKSLPFPATRLDAGPMPVGYADVPRGVSIDIPAHGGSSCGTAIGDFYEIFLIIVFLKM